MKESFEYETSEIEKYDFLFKNNEEYNSNPNHMRFEVALRFLKMVNVYKILDVGVGRGHLFYKIKDDFDVYGLEPSDYMRMELNEPNIVKGYTHKIPFENEFFDLVFCLDVLEHVEENFIAVSIVELNRVTKRYLIISVADHEDNVGDLILHITLKRFPDWEKLFALYFLIINKELVWSLNDKSKISMVYLLEKKN